MAQDELSARPRYGCQECQEDAELVMSQRATAQVTTLHADHLRRCVHCRNMQRLLGDVYQGPGHPSLPAGNREDREFHAVLRRMHHEREQPWQSRWTLRAGVGALAVSAAVLALTVARSLHPELHLGQTAENSTPVDIAEDAPAHVDDVPPESDIGDDTRFRHAAQAYGRVLGGSANVFPAGGAFPTNSNTFSVGTELQLDNGQTVQVGVIGRIVANFAPGSDVVWESASPSLVELRVERGMTAFRYDRESTDPVLQVRTPTALVRVVGTVFTVEVDEDHDTLVSVLRGQVDVIDLETNRTMAEVESGYRYDVAKATFDDVGKLEVQAALPLSVEVDGSADPLVVPAERIPISWNVPGLPTDPESRTLANVPTRPGSPTYVIAPIRVEGAKGSPSEPPSVPPEPEDTRAVEDEGDDLIDELMRDAAATHRKELKAALEQCRDLYESNETRYRAAKCFSDILAKYHDHPAASEAWALLGILRMDFALDYVAAEVALQNYLQRSPNGRLAEIAMYRMWLASVEDGRISQALQRGREYLGRYPNGRFVGKVIQRFPELKSEI